MHFELSTHWRSRVLSRPSTSLKIMQDIRDLMNKARFLMKNLLSGGAGGRGAVFLSLALLGPSPKILQSLSYCF